MTEARRAELRPPRILGNGYEPVGGYHRMEVAGEASDGREALARCRELQPDGALLDIRVPGLDGLEEARRLPRDQPAIHVAMLTTFDLDSASTRR
jgi:DNA-binding NarL/FixJ family response regulator